MRTLSLQERERLPQLQHEAAIRFQKVPEAILETTRSYGAIHREARLKIAPHGDMRPGADRCATSWERDSLGSRGINLDGCEMLNTPIRTKNASPHYNFLAQGIGELVITSRVVLPLPDGLDKEGHKRQ